MNFRVSPSEVAVTVQGNPKALQNLQTNDIRAIVGSNGSWGRPRSAQARRGVGPRWRYPGARDAEEVQVIFLPTDEVLTHMSSPRKIFGTDGVRGNGEH